MIAASALISLAAFLASSNAQQVGTYTAETHPSLSWQQCTGTGSCTTQAGKIVLDSNWRWTHIVGGYTNCYTGNTWNATVCTSGATCAANCALDGADYTGTYGITASGSSVKLNFVTTSTQTNVGSRIYLMDTDTTYKLFKPLNREFTFDVDVSTLPCGLNGAVYFSNMDADGGVGKYPNNKAGAKYGTGYCDSQCPRDLKFINGVANSDGWTPDSNSANSGTGKYGSCCTEMDIWEANSISTAYTPHPCGGATGQTECTGTQCGATSDSRYGGFCDPDGCDFNSYRMGNTSFYGKGLTVDTSKVFTIVTQFITSDGTDSGTLSEIRRFYVQNGKTIPNSLSTISGIDPVNSITDNFCKQQKAAFGDQTSFQANGGLAALSKGLSAGTVLVLSIWDDYAAQMLWLDSDYPLNKSTSLPGVPRGTCDTSSGAPPDVEKSAASAYVTYSNIKFGTIGSTFSSTGTTTSVGSGTPTTTSSGSAATQTKYGQCGGQGWTGPTTCAAGSTCKYSSQYYSQCL